MSTLDKAAARTVKRIVILPLHGTPFECARVSDAMAFVRSYRRRESKAPAMRYEVEILYDNDDRIEGSFADKDAALEFLHTFEPPSMTPAYS